MFKKKILYILIFSFFVTSCVYFNTFYNAQDSYKKALKIIEESPPTTDNKLPSQADKLLVGAIENSKLVVLNYPENKLVDDAIYIIARSSLLRNEIAVAKNNFEKIINLYPDSEYFDLSQIWFLYTKFRMGFVNDSFFALDSMKIVHKGNKKHLFIIHNALAEIELEKKNLDEVYYHYELAANITTFNSKKTSIYSKLVQIAELEKDNFRVSKYLEKLGRVAPDKIRIESKMQWIIYQRKLAEYDNIIAEISNLLSLSEFESKYIKLELELGKVYFDKGEYDLAKEILSQLVEVYSKKDETSEAYYYLGLMALNTNFNLDIAKEYFEKSKLEKTYSTYGRKSQEYLEKILRFENLKNIYKKTLKNPSEEVVIDVENIDDDFLSESNNSFIDTEQEKLIEQYDDYGNLKFDFNNGEDSPNINFDQNVSEIQSESVIATPDSVLFMISEMLLYDFNKLDESLDSFEQLAQKYPNSQFASKALYVLSHYEPNSNWHNRLDLNNMGSLDIKFPDNNVSLINNNYKLDRDYAWSLAKKSYLDSYNEFNRLAKEEGDTVSAYILGFISDIYLNDITSAINDYQKYITKYPLHYYVTDASDRLEEIKANLEEVKQLSQQGIDYQIAYKYLLNTKDYDSTKILLTDIINSGKSFYQNAAKELKSAIVKYEQLKVRLETEDDINLNTENKNLSSNFKFNQDSIMYELATLFEVNFGFRDSSIKLHKDIVNIFIESKYRPQSLLFLKKYDSKFNWSNMLISEYPSFNSTLEVLPSQIVYNRNILDNNFNSTMRNNILDCNKYLELLPIEEDSILIHNEEIVIPYDTLNNMNLNESKNTKKNK